MRLVTTPIIVWLTVAFGACAGASEKQEGRATPRNLHWLMLADGSILTVLAPPPGLEGQKTREVWMIRHAMAGSGTTPTWRTPPLTSVEYVPGMERYYALIKVLDDRLFVFFMWNGHHCIIDKQTGQVLKKGDGDDVLREYGALLPLKLLIPRFSSNITKKEAERLEKEKREGERNCSAIFRIQVVPGSKLKNFYVIQFDKPGSDRRPLLVVAWKAEDEGSIDMDGLDRADVAITIHGHLMAPSRTKKAVYLLQPNYSLQQLSLADEEIARLFSYITRSEERAVTSEELQLLPSDPYWKEKVAAHLKVVEPP